MMDERRHAEAPRLAEHAPECGGYLAKKRRELDCVAPDTGQRLGHILGEELKRLSLLKLRPLGMAAPTYFLDEDTERFGRSGVMGTQTAFLPGGGCPLQQHGARRIDLGDAGDIHLAGEVGCRRERHAQALQSPIEPVSLGDGPGAGGHQAERGALKFDAKSGRAGLRRQDNLMVALEHRRA